MPRGQGGKAACPVTKHLHSNASPFLLRAADRKRLLQDHFTLFRMSEDSKGLLLKGVLTINTILEMKIYKKTYHSFQNKKNKSVT